jgi:histidine ammonia-lyase
MLGLFNFSFGSELFSKFARHDNFPSKVTLTGEELSLTEFLAIASGTARLCLSEAAMKNVAASRACVEQKAQSPGQYYGINTGFGALANVSIPPENLKLLQINLVRSHACGVGDPLPEPVVRGVLALRIQTMLRGHSGVHPKTIELMQSFLNHKITPFVPSKGSVGASGDLAPLAHIALALIGEGNVYYQGNLVSSAEALKECSLVPLSPGPKEGLSLINGTQVMTALGLLSLAKAHELILNADLIATLTLEGMRGTATSLDPKIHEARKHPGQRASAELMRKLLLTDPGTINSSHTFCSKVQDPYSIRCAPQVHGATRDCIEYATKTLMCEANSSTDNPLVFAETDEILSGGNFHGQPIALALDFAAIGLSELCSISERRTDKLITGSQSQLPPFLVQNSGLNSGFMIPHVVSASLVSENKILSHPASVDSIPTSAQQEDHVSMGMTSALKFAQIIQNCSYVLAIEALAAAQALDLLKPLETSKTLRQVHHRIRSISKHYSEDRSLHNDISRLSKSISDAELLEPLFENGILTAQI